MKDHSKKLHELREDSSAVFEGIFGKKEEPQTGTGQVVKLGVGKYRMWTSLITGLNGASDSQLMNYDFESSKLNWLLDCEFEGILNLDLKRGELKSFAGVWKSGTFLGGTFGNNSTFAGGEFGKGGVVKPLYMPPFDSWKASPLAFNDGTIDRDTGGILGIPNAPNGNITGPINIISIQPGKTLTIKLRNNVSHQINFLKRIDAQSSDFVIETVNGESGESLKKTFEWADSKKALNKEFNPFKTRAFLGLDLTAGVVSATITSSGKDALTHKSAASAQATPASLSKEQKSIPLADMAFLGIPKISRGRGSTPQGAATLFFNFPTPSHMLGFDKAVKAMKDGWTKSYITQIRTALENNVIAGAPATHQYLSNLIGKDPDLDMATVDKELANALNGMENFLKFVVNTAVRRVRKSGKEKGLADVKDTKGIEVMNNKLKELLGLVEPEAEPEAPKAQKQAEPEAPKQVRRPGLKESIRKIISDNIEHF